MDIPMDKITHLVIGQMCWGTGASFEEAKANFKKHGADLRKPHNLYTFGASSTCAGVDDMGAVHYHGDEPVYTKIR